MKYNKRNNKKGRNHGRKNGARKHQDYDEKLVLSDMRMLFNEHATRDGVPSLEDLAWVSNLLRNGMRVAPLRKSLREDPINIGNMIKVESGSKLDSILSGPESLGGTSRETYKGHNIDHEKWLIDPIAVGKTDRWVVDPKRVTEAKKLGILVKRKYPFDMSRKVVNAEFYKLLIDMVKTYGENGLVTRMTNREEEKDGVR